jgi:hypothetical protein
MSGPKNQDKSLHGLSVGLGIAGTIAATIIIFAYAASDGSSYLPVLVVPSEDTAAAKEPALPVDDTKQELQLVQDETQDQIGSADKIVIERQEARQTGELDEESTDVSSVGYDPVDADKSDDSSSPAKSDDVQEPVNNDENGLTPPLPTLPLLEGENDGDDDRHKKSEAKEHKDKKHGHDDSIASIVFKGDKHQKDN